MSYEDLRRAAEAASPGPWGNEPPSRERATIHHIIREHVDGPQVANVLLDEDAAYIALASPDRILGILKRQERLEAALDDGGLVDLLWFGLGQIVRTSRDGRTLKVARAIVEEAKPLFQSREQARAALEGKPPE